MYNEKIKKDFLDYVAKTDVGGTKAYGYKKFFDAIAEKEEQLNKDLYKMSTAEAIETLNISKKRSCVINYLSKARKYLDWCTTMDYCNINRLHKAFVPTDLVIQSTDTNKDNVYYMSKEVFDDYMEKLINDPSCGAYAASMLGAIYYNITYSGFENLAYLSVDDIDKEAGTVKTKDGAVHIVPDQLIDLLLESSKTFSILTRTRTQQLQYSHTPNAIWNFAKDGKIDRHFRYILEQRIRVVCKNENLNTVSIAASGLFNHIKERSKELGLDLKSDMINDFKRNNNGSNLINLKYKHLFEEYCSDIEFTTFKYRFAQWVDYIN